MSKRAWTQDYEDDSFPTLEEWLGRLADAIGAEGGVARAGPAEPARDSSGARPVGPTGPGPGAAFSVAEDSVRYIACDI